MFCGQAYFKIVNSLLKKIIHLTHTIDWIGWFMKNNLLKAAAFGSVLAMTATASHAAGDQDKYQLSSHILDISTGKPAQTSM